MSLTFYLIANRPTNVFSGNITHNLNTMASAAGIYKCLWRPEEAGVKKAHDLIAPLAIGLKRLRDEPDFFKGMNPDNGWGDYDGLVKWVEELLNACVENPDATISVHR